MSSPRVDIAVEQLGFGKQQIFVLIPGGFAYAAVSAVAVGAAQAARAVGAALGHVKQFIGLLTSCVFVGYLIGSLLSGPFADQCGRRIPLMSGFVGLSLCQALAAIFGSSDAFVLAASFVGCGICMGLGPSGANANIKEWTPAHFRPRIFCMLSIFLTLGQMAAGLFFALTSPNLTPENLQWEFLFMLQSLVCAIMFVFAALLLPESAHWLICNGKLEEGEKALVSAANRNGVNIDKQVIQDAVTIIQANLEAQDATPLKEDAAKSQSIFSGALLRTTVIMCWLNFVANACYYGLICTLPSTLSLAFKGTGVVAAHVMLASMAFELPGIVLQDLLGRRLSRQVNIAAVFTIISISFALLAGSLNFQFTQGVVSSSVSSKMLVVASFIITYLAMAEAYPVACRATGCGFCMTVGRLGAVLAPMVYEAVGDSTFYAGLCLSSVIAAIAGYCLKM